jgi:hypothetical protein
MMEPEYRPQDLMAYYKLQSATAFHILYIIIAARLPCNLPPLFPHFVSICKDLVWLTGGVGLVIERDGTELPGLF